MSRYSNIEWAGKTVRRAVEFILTVTEQTWDYGPASQWRVPADCIMQLGIDPLIKAYDTVAHHHGLPNYSGRRFVGGLIGSQTHGKDQTFVRKEMTFIATIFENAMQYMANNDGWQQSQEGMEKVALERLENLIRFCRGFNSSSDEKRFLESNPTLAA